MIQRKDNAHWEPPGGVLEIGESILDGLRREVLEETGLIVEPERLTGVYKNMVRGVVALVFKARAVGGSQLSSGDEIVAAAWISPNQVDVRCDEAYAVRVRDALLPGVAIRSHDGVRLLAR
jgi:8-oxo-dGTP diphosphatase